MNNIKFELISFRLHLHNIISIFSQQYEYSTPFAPFFLENARFNEDSRKRWFHFKLEFCAFHSSN